MKLAVTTTTPDVPRPSPVALLSGPLEQRIARAAALGLDGLELMVLDPAQIDAPALLRLLAGAGLAAAAIASGAQASQAGLTLLAPEAALRERALARLLALIDLAHALPSPLVTVGSFRGRLGGTADGRALLVDALGRACQHAARAGVRLVLEPLNRYETDIIATVEDGLALIDEVGHPSLGLLLDAFHANIEEATFAGAIGAAMQAGRLWHVHIADSNRLPPGQGHIDFAAIVAALSALGYDAYLSAECFPLPDPDAAAATFCGHMRSLVPIRTFEVSL